jgi:SAM-dependent methyltransferase
VEARAFWDRFFEEGVEPGSRVDHPDPHDPVLNAAAEHFGDVGGKTVLDLGCGRGATSLFFASRGASVVSVDFSAAAIRNLTGYCAERGITSVQPVQASAMEIAELAPVDFVYGSMILHHIEPFDRFAVVLRETIRPGGRAFFYENSSRSALMIWFRENVVGRFGVPKYGDAEEFPLTPAEIDQLRLHFGVEVECPELYFFRMIPIYLLRNRFVRPFAWLDRVGYRFPALRKVSYRQYIRLTTRDG